MSIIVNSKIQKELASALAKVKELQEAANAENAARLEKVNAKIAELPKHLGVEDHDEVFRLINAYRKGNLKGSPAGSGDLSKRLTEEQVTEIKAALKNGAQVSTLANKYGVTAPSIYRYKKMVEAEAIAPILAAVAEPAAQ
jgi:hypothetical protein